MILIFLIWERDYDVYATNDVGDDRVTFVKAARDFVRTNRSTPAVLTLVRDRSTGGYKVAQNALLRPFPSRFAGFSAPNTLVSGRLLVFAARIIGRSDLTGAKSVSFLVCRWDGAKSRWTPQKKTVNGRAPLALGAKNLLVYNHRRNRYEILRLRSNGSVRSTVIVTYTDPFFENSLRDAVVSMDSKGRTLVVAISVDTASYPQLYDTKFPAKVYTS